MCRRDNHRGGIVIVVFAIDALEHKLVEEFNAKHLKQAFYGKTNIEHFSQPRTMVLWSSFLTGQNKESEVLGEGNKEMWNRIWKQEETFLKLFKSPVVLDLPGFSYQLEAHEKSRLLLRSYFETDDKAKKEEIRKEYNKDAFDHHRKVKEQFLKALEGDHDFVLGYFSVVDVIGHLNFGNKVLMKMLYKEMDEMAEKLRNIPDVKLLIISDHGMEGIGMFGDHSRHGFWSTNFYDRS